MSSEQNWLTRPENYRAVQNIRRRIRAIYGDDIRITSTEDLAKLVKYKNGDDIELNSMLAEFEQQAPFSLSDCSKSTPNPAGSDSSGSPPTRVYRGRIVSG